MASERDVVVLSGVRTAIGDYGGGLKNHGPSDLGAMVVKERDDRISASRYGMMMRRIGRSHEDVHRKTKHVKTAGSWDPLELSKTALGG